MSPSRRSHSSPSQDITSTLFHRCAWGSEPEQTCPLSASVTFPQTARQGIGTWFMHWKGSVNGATDVQSISNFRDILRYDVLQVAGGALIIMTSLYPIDPIVKIHGRHSGGWPGLQHHGDSLFGRGGVADIMVQDQQPGPDYHQDQWGAGRFRKGET